MGTRLSWRIGSVTVLRITTLAFTGHWAGPTLAQIKLLAFRPGSNFGG